jgi:Septum formation
MPGFFGRGSSLTEADKARLREAEEVVAEFEAAVDDAVELARQLRADGAPDETLSRLAAHRMNWRAAIRTNLKDARKAFERGEPDQAEVYLERATAKSRQGMDDLDGRIAALLDEGVRPPPGSAEAASWISIDDPRLRVLREIPVGSCFNVNIGADERAHGFLVVPCSEPHALEMFGRGEVAPDFSTFPDPDRLAAEGDRICRPLFGEYVGRDYNRSEYTFWAYYPEPDTWPDDRTIHCALGNEDRTVHEGGSAKDSRR